MTFTYHGWPFLPRNMHTPEQEKLWWQFCFVKTSPIINFLNASGSAAVVGGAGSGKSICLEVLRREMADTALQIEYLPHNWPNGTKPWMPGETHASQMMAAAAVAIRHQLELKPEQFVQLNDLQKEFFFALIDKHLQRRALRRLCYRLQQAIDIEIEIPDKMEDLFPTEPTETDIWNQISELADLAQGLGYEQVILLIDLNELEAIEHMEDIVSLFSWLALMEHPDWSIRAALPHICLKEGQLAANTSGRLDITRLNYDQVTIQRIAAGYLRVAMDGEYDSLLGLVDTAILEHARKEIQAIYQQPTLAGWLNWVEASLATAVNSKCKLPLSDAKAITRTYYERHFPLRLMPDRQGVWRGPQFLPLDERPYEILKKLFDLRGRSDPNILLEMAGSGENLNTLISRLRREIEPLKGAKIYLQNRRDQGYWLENFVL
jgi:hypothetical protein